MRSNIMSDYQHNTNQVYFDRKGFSSKQVTLQYAKQIDKTINIADMDEFFRTNVAQKRKLRGWFLKRNMNTNST